MTDDFMLDLLNMTAKKGGGHVEADEDAGFWIIYDENGKECHRTQLSEEAVMWMEVRIAFKIPFSSKRHTVKRGCGRAKGRPKKRV